MRLFTAVPVSKEARDHLSALQMYLRQDWLDAPGMARITWVRPEILHITLKFLGELKQEQVPAIRGALSSVPVECMELHADRFERFPKRGPIRVLAAGIGGDAGRVMKLFERIEAECEQHGIPAERRDYTPHITIGRAKEGPRIIGSAMGEANLERFWPGPSFVAREFQLLKSTLTPAGPIYEPLATYENR